MKYTTIFEKLLCIFDLISKSWLNILFVGIATILLILLVCKKLSKKKCFLFITIACFVLLSCTIIRNFDSLSKMMNILIDNLFTNIYFPSTYAYLFILIVIDVVSIGNLLNPKIEKVYKTIHGICFIVINFILTIILEMVAKYEIDIFSKGSLFSNTDFVTLLEFSMNVFIIWLVSLLITYLINLVTDRIVITKENKEVEINVDSMVAPEVVISADSLKEEYNQVKDNVEVPANVDKVETVAFIPDTTKNHFIPTVTVDVVNEEKNSQIPEVPVVIQPAVNYGDFSQQSSILESAQTFETAKSVNENTFDLSAFIPKKQEIRPIQNFEVQTNTTNQIFEQILNNELPVIHEETKKIEVKNEKELEKDTYTLNDYKTFNKMLKDIREHNQSSSIQIDKMLEYRLITKYSTETYQMFQKMLKIYSN